MTAIGGHTHMGLNCLCAADDDVRMGVRIVGKPCLTSPQFIYNMDILSIFN